MCGNGVAQTTSMTQLLKKIAQWQLKCCTSNYKDCRKATKNCLVTTLVLMQLKLQAWEKCHTKWFSINLDADLVQHCLVITYGLMQLKPHTMQKCYTELLSSNLMLMQLKLEAWENCYRKLPSKYLSADIALTTCMAKLRQTMGQ